MQLSPQALHDELESDSRAMLARADRCVACGLCLPHCPTYGLSQLEGESPRGRIALIRGLASGDLQPSDSLVNHLDRCLGCQNCESVCPAEVEYGALLADARAWLRERHRLRNHPADAASGWMARHPNALRLLRAVGLLYNASGLGRLAAWLGIRRLAPLARVVPDGQGRGAQRSFARKDADSVLLFSGCFADVFDRRAAWAARQVLQQLGFAATSDPGLVCCGAIDLHSGRRAQAQSLMDSNTRCFQEASQIVSLNSGCTATLARYQALSQVNGAEHYRVDQICPFLLHNNVGRLSFGRLEKTVYLHVPCSMKNALQEPEASASLLQLIPGLELRRPPAETLCCGAAGTYMLRHRREARALGAGLADAVLASGVEVMATSNMGCALHLETLLAQRGRRVEVVHPVELLAQSLNEAPHV